MTEKDEDDELGGLVASNAADRKILWSVLLINLGQSAAGIGLGIWAASTALMGAGLDNLADASVYAVSLYAVGRTAIVKVRAARLSGFLLSGSLCYCWWRCSAASPGARSQWAPP